MSYLFCFKLDKHHDTSKECRLLPWFQIRKNFENRTYRSKVMTIFRKCSVDCATPMSRWCNRPCVPRFLCHFSLDLFQTWYVKRHWLVDNPYEIWSLGHFRFSRYSTFDLYVLWFLCHFSSNNVQTWYDKRHWLVHYPYKIWSLWHLRFSRYSTFSLYVP